MGCWADTATRAMTSLEGAAVLDGAYGERQDAINKCFIAARNKGYEYFALQGGSCWGSAFGDDTSYAQYGESESCEKNGKGGTLKNNVYRITLGYRSIGKCYRTPHNGLNSLEGTDTILDDNHTLRDDAIGKCYTVSLNNGYKYFGLVDGGLCFAGSTFDYSAIPLDIAECGAEGDGGPTSYMIYEIMNDNVALGKTTSQSSILPYRGDTVASERAILTTSDGTCIASLTNYEQTPYWRLDLGLNLNISKLVIHPVIDAQWIHNPARITSCIPGNNIAREDLPLTQDFEQCKVICLNSLNCLSFDFQHTSEIRRCQISGKHSLTMPISEPCHLDDYKYYEYFKPDLNNFGIYIGQDSINIDDPNQYDVCFEQTSIMSGPHEVRCYTDLRGRYVMIQKNDQSESSQLGICQVEVYVERIYCSEVSVNPHTRLVRFDGRQEGDVAIFECLPGNNMLSGEYRVTCLANGEWSDSSLVCSGCCDLTKNNATLLLHNYNALPLGQLPGMIDALTMDRNTQFGEFEYAEFHHTSIVVDQATFRGIKLSPGDSIFTNSSIVHSNDVHYENISLEIWMDLDLMLGYTVITSNTFGLTFRNGTVAATFVGIEDTITISYTINDVILQHSNIVYVVLTKTMTAFDLYMNAILVAHLTTCIVETNIEGNHHFYMDSDVAGVIYSFHFSTAWPDVYKTFKAAQYDRRAVGCETEDMRFVTACPSGSVWVPWMKVGQPIASQENGMLYPCDFAFQTGCSLTTYSEAVVQELFEENACTDKSYCNISYSEYSNMREDSCPQEEKVTVIARFDCKTPESAELEVVEENEITDADPFATCITLGPSLTKQSLQLKIGQAADIGDIIVNIGVKYGEPSHLVHDVQDHQLTASSSYSAAHDPNFSRLNTISTSGQCGCWAAAVNDQNQWIQVDFETVVHVSGVITQGRSDYSQWVTSYTVSHSLDAINFINHTLVNGTIRVFTGNIDQNSTVAHQFGPEFNARIVRIHPREYYVHMSMRFDILGDKLPEMELIDAMNVPDDHFSVSSTHSHSTPLGARARLNYDDPGGCRSWCAGSNDANQYIEVDLGRAVFVSGIVTQGRHDYDQWVKSYKLKYKAAEVEPFVGYTEDGIDKIFNANTDRDTIVQSTLKIGGVFARYIRIHPVTWANHISMRMGILGYPYAYDTIVSLKHNIYTSESTSAAEKIPCTGIIDTPIEGNMFYIFKCGSRSTQHKIVEIELMPGFLGETVDVCDIAIYRKELGCPPETESIENGRASTTFANRQPMGTIIEYECDTGYETNSSVIICQKNGTWSEANCTNVSCDMAPQELQGGTLEEKCIGTNGYYKDNCTYSCNIGYTMNGSNVIQCMEDRNWTAIPECIIKDCGEPGSVEKGTLRYNSTVFNSTATVNCDIGHELSSESNMDGIIRCNASGLWDGYPIGCSIKDCGKPESAQNGDFSYNSTVFNSTATVDCDIGHELSSESNMDGIIRCNESGLWDGYPIGCSMKDCGKPEPVESGDLSYNSTVFNSTATVNCDIGYELSLESNVDGIIRCNESGSWDGYPIGCSLKDCDTPESAQNGDFSYNSTVFNSTAIISCDIGHELSSESNMDGIIRCNESGLWDGYPIGCSIKDCGKPEPVESGDFSYNSTVFNSTAKVNCDIGYELSSESNEEGMIRCNESGLWDGYPIGCTKKDCGKPGLVERGNFTYNSTVFNSTAIISCDIGYELSLESNAEGIIRCNESGLWDGFPIECIIKDCGEAPLITNGAGDGLGTTYEETWHYVCDPGFDLIGEKNITCLETATWTDAPNCTIKNCSFIPIWQNGHVVASDGLTYGSTIDFLCDHGYTHEGETRIECLETGLWSELGECKRVYCAPHPTINHAFILHITDDNGSEKLDEYIGSGIFNATVDTMIEYRCDLGYNMSGNSTITCLQSGNWTSPAECNIVQCGPPDDIINSTVQYNQTFYNSTTVYDCAVGNILIGDNTSRCLEDSTWTSPPFCLFIDCHDPPYVSHSTTGYTDNRTTVYAKVDYECDIGYDMVGNSTASCSVTGNWSDIPVCVIADCGEPPNVPFSTWDQNTTTTYDSVLTYTCFEGYKMIQMEPNTSSYASCSANGCYDDTIACSKNMSCDNGLSANSSFQCPTNRSCYEFFDRASTVRCLPIGNWNTTPVCEPKDCGLLNISNGSMVYFDNSTTYGSNVSMSCDEAYYLNGDSTLQCNADGQWSNISECVAIDCFNIPSVDNSVFLNPSNNTLYGSVVNYTCDIGYFMTGNDSITCMNNGSWSSPPECTIHDCGEMPNISNGIGRLTHKTLLNMTTVNNTHLDTLNKTITQMPHIHDITKAALIDALNGSMDPRIAMENTTHGPNMTITEFQNDDDVNANKTTSNDTNVDGSMMNNDTDIRNVSNVHLITSNDVRHNPGETLYSTTYLSMGEYTCDDGFNMYGDPKTICLADGTWSQAPVCSLYDCGDLPVVHNANVAVNLDSTNDKIIATFTCVTGYFLVGNESIECEAGSSWTTDTPKCEIVNCGMPRKVARAVREVTDITYGSMVKYTCEKGNILHGSSTAECKEDGSWSPYPECSLVDCGPLPRVQNAIGHLRGTTTTYGRSAYYTCAWGHRAYGDTNIHCQADGLWSFPCVCSPLDCGDIPLVLNSSAAVRLSQSIALQINYQCDPGYKLIGHPQVTCMQIEEWSAIPSCNLITTTPLPTSPATTTTSTTQSTTALQSTLFDTSTKQSTTAVRTTPLATTELYTTPYIVATEPPKAVYKRVKKMEIPPEEAKHAQVVSMPVAVFPAIFLGVLLLTDLPKIIVDCRQGFRNMMHGLRQYIKSRNRIATV
ncbi:unnamed protein product [Owenia fusiformis]|uniref:Uncharacterized protein n=1 Tax=Owenia fusiformis TaxID=6347 RepID=A0A8S4N935_OWEFU|nr:unnamed protein product [Owenia fusiformis]